MNGMRMPKENFYDNSAFRNFSRSDVEKYFPLLLTDIEKKVLEKRYDSDGNTNLSLREIGRAIGISSSRASDVLKQIKAKVTLFSEYNKNKIISLIKSEDVVNNLDFTNYYNRLCLDIITIIDKYNNNDDLNIMEDVLLSYYMEIEDCIDTYCPQIRIDSKTKQLIETIQEIDILPSRTTKDEDLAVLFENGGNQRFYYDNLLRWIPNILCKKKNNKILYPIERNKLYEYMEICLKLNDSSLINLDDRLSDVNSISVSEDILKEEISKLDNPVLQSVLYDIFGLNSSNSFKDYTQISKEVPYSVSYIFKIVSRFKESVDYLRGKSNYQIICELNNKRKKIGNKMIISNNALTLIEYIDIYHSCDNNQYYLYLKRNIPGIIKKIDNDIVLTYKERQLLNEYELISKKLSEFGRKGQFIESIHKFKGKFNKSDRDKLVFDSGKKQLSYYYDLRSSVNYILRKMYDGIKISYKEQKLLEDYYDIKQVFDLYSKTNDLIYTINVLHRLPRRKTDGISEITFDDGKDQYNYYINLKNTVDSINRRESDVLTLEDIEAIDNYNKVQEALIKNSKTNELIEIIDTVKRAPLSGVDDVKFRDGTSSYGYYMKLRDKYYHIIINNSDYEELSKLDKIIVKDYLTVKKHVEMYSKKSQLINNIKRIRRIPSKDEAALFNDGTNQRRYYYNLVNCARKLEQRYNNGEVLNLHDLELIDDYYQISNVLSFFQCREKNNKELIIKLCEDNGIDISKNESLLNKSFYEIYTKMIYLKENGFSLCDKSGIVNKIFFISELDMINVYGISIDDLLDKYINGDCNSLGNSYVKKTVLKK